MVGTGIGVRTGKNPVSYDIRQIGRRVSSLVPAGFIVSSSSGSDSTPAASAEIGTLELVEYPHPALLRKAKPLLKIDESIRDAIEQMFDIMYDAQGVGLAANQVALPYRMFVINVTADPNAGEELVFLNPTLSRPRGNATQEEGCLSLPGLRADVRRPERVVVDAWGLDGQPIHADLDGFLARVVQHEFDHLEGRLFTDRLPEAAALEVKRELELFEEMFVGKQSRGELPDNDALLARLDQLEAERCNP
jgi:peptide deformylase